MHKFVFFLSQDIPKHGFRPGMKVEAVDLMEPRSVHTSWQSSLLLNVNLQAWFVKKKKSGALFTPLPIWFIDPV